MESRHVDRTKEYSFVLSTMPRLHARSRLLELGEKDLRNKMADQQIVPVSRRGYTVPFRWRNNFTWNYPVSVSSMNFIHSAKPSS